MNDPSTQLRSGVSYWRETCSRRPPARVLEGDITCRVVVLGGGISGALVADMLIREGVETVLIDRGEPAAASTAASTGLLQYEVDTPLVDLIGQVGREHAVHAYRRGRQAVDELDELTSQLLDRCGFSRRDSLYFASSRWHTRGLRQEFERRREHGFAVEYLERRALAAISSINAAGAILSAGDAQVDPYRLTVAVLERAAAAGLRIHGGTTVTAIDETSEGVRLRTAGGSVAAREIVYATGYQAHEQLGRQVGSLHSTYVAVSQPMPSIEGWPHDWLLWETARPYFYARRLDDGRAMIGGEDTSFKNDHRRDALVERKARRLKRRFEKLFPTCQFTPEYTWAGTFAETKDGLAYLGREKSRPRALFALGYGGNGITYSMIAARLLADLIVGRANPDESVFRFDR